jgi:hypothetical protein
VLGLQSVGLMLALLLDTDQDVVEFVRKRCESGKQRGFSLLGWSFTIGVKAEG